MSEFTNSHAVVAAFRHHASAAAALGKLQHSGYSMKHISIVGRDYHTDGRVIAYYNAGDRMNYWSKGSPIWGEIWGMLYGSGFFLIPEFGPLLAAGPLVASIVGALDGEVPGSGESAVAEGIHNLGVRSSSILVFEKAIKEGMLVIVANGSLEKCGHACDILKSAGPEITQVYEPDMCDQIDVSTNYR